MLWARARSAGTVDDGSNDHRPTATAPKKPTGDRRPDSEQALSEKKCNRCNDFMTVKESTQKSGTCNKCHHGSTRRSSDTHDATPRTHDYQGRDTRTQQWNNDDSSYKPGGYRGYGNYNDYRDGDGIRPHRRNADSYGGWQKHQH